jgi:hypothetical protein
MLSNNRNQLTKLFLSVLFILLALAIYSLQYYTPGYKFSIYDNLPYGSLILLIVINICGFFITLVNYRKKSNYWKLGFILIILTNMMILLIPFLTGYIFSSNSDHLTHIGYIKDIIQTGLINSAFNRDIYPITPIFGAETSLFTGISVNTIAFFIGPIFYLLFMLYIYNFSNSISPNSKFFALLASTILLGYYFKEIFPMGYAFLTYPLIFYVFFKYREERNINFAFIAVLLVCFMAFFHMISAIILTVLLFSYEIFNYLYGIIYLKKRDYKISLTLTILSLIVIIAWISQISWVWKDTVYNILNFANLDLISKPMVQNAAESFNKLGLNISQVIDLFIRTYLPIFIFAILSAFTGLKLIFSKKLAIENRLILVLSMLTVICIVLWLIDYVFPLSSLSSGRLIWLVVPLFPLFVGISLFSITNTSKIKNDKVKYFSVFIILITCSLISIFAIYPSPQIYEYNTAVSNSEFASADWAIVKSTNEFPIMTAGFQPIYRYKDAIDGTVNNEERRYPMMIPDHFNYTDSSEIGKNYPKDRYMIFKPEFLTSLYGNLYKNLNRFDKEDFVNLNTDKSVFKIYQNGDSEVWYIHSESN